MIRAGIEAVDIGKVRATSDRHEKFVGEVVPGRTVMQMAGSGRAGSEP